MTADPTPAADPRRKPQTIKGHALSSALKHRAVEWSSEVDVDAWIADIEAEARAATTEAVAQAAALDRLPDGGWTVARHSTGLRHYEVTIHGSGYGEGKTIPDAIAAALAATRGDADGT